MAADAILDRLNAEQRRAAEAVRGPVCILAGAGSGKTTTITHRIANQVAAGAFPASAILAVTFTDKAATEMRTRLGALGVEGVAARTFHAAALAQLRALSAEPPASVLPSKALVLRHIANGLPKPYRFRPAADLATEIEWAKNRRLTPDRYESSLDGHRPPIPADLMTRVFRQYERRKRERDLADFEDLLELAIRMYDEDATARARFRERYRAFTVDEYQDVNLLQQTLLERWLGERDELCAVGDDYQSIYAFTGATPRYLLELARRFPNAAVIRLEENYRSTPEILSLANRLTPKLGGAPKTLRATRAPGRRPELRPFAARQAETAFVVEQIRRLHEDDGVPYGEMAVLYRTNARSEDYEEALAKARIPYRVRAGAFLGRAAARRLLPSLRRSRATDVAAEVRRAAEAEGWLRVLPEGLGEYETTRQHDLARLVRLAEEFDDGVRTAADFVADLEDRLGSGDGEPDGVNLLTYHRAKGLEFDAVFLPRLEEHELPGRQAKTPDAIAEERRLLYVGITRAKRYLTLTWAGKPSRFLHELDAVPDASPRPEPRSRPEEDRASEDSPVYAALREWRRKRAQADAIPAYVVFHDKTLAEIVRTLPRTPLELAAVTGVGPGKLARYGEEVLATLAAARR